MSLACGALLLGGSVLFWHSGAGTLAMALLLGSYAAGSFYPVKDALRLVRKRQITIEGLMIFAAYGAASLGRWQEGALLLFLFSMGHALEHYALAKVNEGFTALGKITPREALVRREGLEQLVAVEDLRKGDCVIIKPGERIPSDGIVIEGRSSVDQSVITGESIPSEKTVNDLVYAGTINGSGALQIEVTRLSSESMLSRVLVMIKEAQASKSPSQRFSERFEALFAPVVLLTVLLLLFLPPIWGEPFTSSLYRALAVLVAASPCALALATPSAILAGIARAAQEGVLIKGGIPLENLGTVQAVAFDKTGTITEGKPMLTAIAPANGFSENELLITAASCESACSHPLARALTDEAEKRNLTLTSPSVTEVICGQGLSSSLGGEQVLIGKPSFFSGEALPGKLGETISQWQENGTTAILVKHHALFMGALAFSDRPRPQAREAIRRLEALGITHTVMITGDNKHVAEEIAREVGIGEIRADLMPDEKVTVIAEYTARHGHVAMVGDGINDAPAMAHATVGIAMGRAGTDVAIETADVALMADNLLKVPFVIALGRHASAVIKQNLFLSIGVIGFLITAVILGWLGKNCMSPAVIIHEGSTLLVVLNALRILGFRKRRGVKNLAP
ncbi:MAG: heavy metal translocating P-type ATPase [Candidatus Eremiobacteraeota bacterium]|nr:heavy metal translocating P-type ATPase [Candidatus Eremiobacteraeota bacterium]